MKQVPSAPPATPLESARYNGCSIFRADPVPNPRSSATRVAPPSACILCPPFGLMHIGGEHVEAERTGQECGGSLPAHAVARGVERRRERADAALAWRDGDDAARYAGLGGKADLEQPLSRPLVQSIGRKHG